jgi:hypothetical protein
MAETIAAPATEAVAAAGTSDETTEVSEQAVVDGNEVDGSAGGVPESEGGDSEGLKAEGTQDRDPETGKFLPKKRKFKVKGKEVEVEYKTEEEELRDLQRGRYMAQEREEADKERAEARKDKEEAHALKSQMAELLRMLRDPKQARQVYKQLGADPTEVSKAMLQDWLEEQQMTPEQRELAELKRWKAEQAEAQEKAKKESETAEMTRMEEEQFDLIGKRLYGALQKMGIPPGSPEASEAVKRMAWKMEQANARKQDLDVSDDVLLDSLREDYRNEHKTFYSKLSGQELFEMLGEEGLKKVSEYSAGRQKTPGTIQRGGKAPATANGAPKFKSLKETLAHYEKLALDEQAKQG